MNAAEIALQLLTHYDLPSILSGIRCRFAPSLLENRPFAECLAPKFAPEKTEQRYHTSSQLGQLLREHILSHENQLLSDRHMRFGEILNAPNASTRSDLNLHRGITYV